MNKCPCLHCQNRHIENNKTCHSSCTKYIEWTKERLTEKQQQYIANKVYYDDTRKGKRHRYGRANKVDCIITITDDGNH